MHCISQDFSGAKNFNRRILRYQFIYYNNTPVRTCIVSYYELNVFICLIQNKRRLRYPNYINGCNKDKLLKPTIFPSGNLFRR